MSDKIIGNPLQQAIVSGTIGKKTEPIAKQSTTQTSKSSGFQTSRKKDRNQHTIYLPPVLSKMLKTQAYLEGREMSEVVADAILLYKETKDKEKKL